MIGWFSYLLISFYVSAKNTPKAANKALLFNKLSDAALFLFLLCAVSGSVNSLTDATSFWPTMVEVYTSDKVTNIMRLGMVGVLVCSFCKSAQFGFYF